MQLWYMFLVYTAYVTYVNHHHRYPYPLKNSQFLNFFMILIFHPSSVGNREFQGENRSEKNGHNFILVQ